jgi:hypothetical protein
MGWNNVYKGPLVCLAADGVAQQDQEIWAGITFVTNPGIAPKGREWPSWGMIKKTVLLFMGEW